MEKKELICIGCPMGCQITVSIDQEQQKAQKNTIHVIGNTCPRGKDYAEKEVTNPTRMVTSTVRVTGGAHPLVSVKTKKDIPKDKIFECMKEIHTILVKAPVAIGDVLLEDVAGTGVSIVATKAVKAAVLPASD